MRRIFLIVLLGLVFMPDMASAERRTGRKLDAIRSGRHYDRILTPQLNPDFHLFPNAEARFLNDVRRGRFNLDSLPEGQQRYYRMRLNSDKY